MKLDRNEQRTQEVALTGDKIGIDDVTQYRASTSPRLMKVGHRYRPSPFKRLKQQQLMLNLFLRHLEDYLVIAAVGSQGPSGGSSSSVSFPDSLKRSLSPPLIPPSLSLSLWFFVPTSASSYCVSVADRKPYMVMSDGEKGDRGGGRGGGHWAPPLS